MINLIKMASLTYIDFRFFILIGQVLDINFKNLKFKVKPLQDGIIFVSGNSIVDGTKYQV